VTGEFDLAVLAALHNDDFARFDGAHELGADHVEGAGLRGQDRRA
jgi:hypothetical protein